MAKVKRSVRRNGGTKIELNAFNILFEREHLTMENIYGKVLKDLKSDGDIKHHTHPKITQFLSYKRGFLLNYNKNHCTSGKYKLNRRIKEFEFQNIVNCIIEKIEIKYENLDTALCHSSFYRVIYFLKRHKFENESLLQTTKRIFNILVNKKTKEIQCNNTLIKISTTEKKEERLKVCKGEHDCFDIEYFDIETLIDIYENFIEIFRFFY